MRQALIAGNWKMNKGPGETEEFFQDLNKIELDPSVEVLICPPSIDLLTAKKCLEASRVKLGAQNMYSEDSGPYTGEISPLMLKEVGVDYVIVGHSERRDLFGETDHTTKDKVLAALDNGIRPIVCIGETLEERALGAQKEAIQFQIEEALYGLEGDDLDEMVLAYEPVWAIGTDNTASTEDIDEMTNYIRGLVDYLIEGQAGRIRILYGGSVNPDNIKEVMNLEDVDGALVGGASLDPASFASLVNYKE